METIACPYCGNQKFKILYQIPDLLLERHEVQAQFVRCTNCALVYQNPRPDDAEMLSHYPPEYDSHLARDIFDRPGKFRRRIFQNGLVKRARTITDELEDGRLLDIGCSTGDFLIGMRSSAKGSWELKGVEPGEAAARIAHDRGLDVSVGTLDNVRFESSYFDAVTLWDVFEHVQDPLSTLTEIRRILKPGGILVLRVPNLASLDAKLFRDSWAGFDAPRHTFAFTPDTVGRFLNKAGFRGCSFRSNIGNYPGFVLSVRFWLTRHRFPVSLKKTVLRWLNSAPSRLLFAPIFFIYNAGVLGPWMVVKAYNDPLEGNSSKNTRI